MAEPYETILITGASSGIGEALALEFAGPGVTLGLVSRRREKLEALGRRVEEKGARALVYGADVADLEAIRGAVYGFAERAGGLDLALANAGIGWDPGARKDDEIERMARLVDTNVKGVLLTLAFALEVMERQGRGHIVATGSVAGYRGLPVGPYSASKAFVRTMMDSWRLMVADQNIRVTTIAPGFVRTPIVEDNPFPMPFLIPAEEAARLIRAAILAGKKTAVLPWPWKLVVPLMKAAPDFLLKSFAPRAR